jgi:hypothetical protein
MQAPGRDRGLVATLGRLVRAVPTLELEVGPDVDAIPATLDRAAAVVG